MLRAHSGRNPHSPSQVSLQLLGNGWSVLEGSRRAGTPQSRSALPEWPPQVVLCREETLQSRAPLLPPQRDTAPWLPGCAEQGPCNPRICAGAEPVLPARVSSQPAQGAPTLLCGEAGGGRSNPWQGRVLLLLRGCSEGQGCSQQHIPSEVFPGGCFKGKDKAGAT